MKIYSTTHFDLCHCTVSIDVGRSIDDFILRSNDDWCGFLFAGDREAIRKRRCEDGVASSPRSAAIDSTRRWIGLLTTSTNSSLDSDVIFLWLDCWPVNPEVGIQILVRACVEVYDQPVPFGSSTINIKYSEGALLMGRYVDEGEDFAPALVSLGQEIWKLLTLSVSAWLPFRLVWSSAHILRLKMQYFSPSMSPYYSP